MKVLVTGGSGFIGSHIADKLIDSNYKVRVFDIKEPYRNDVEFYKGDILSLYDVENATKDVDYIFHIAAFSNIDLVKSNPLKTININVIGTINVLEIARRFKVKRILFASSIYAFSRQGHLYTTSKITSEMLCEDYHTLYGLPYTILRFGTAYGPRSRDVDVISLFVKRAFKKEPLIIKGSGNQRRNFIYVEDLADGCVASLKCDSAVNKCYTLASPNSITINELAGKIKNVFNGKVEVKREDSVREDDYGGTSYDIEKSFINLKWKPKVDIEEGIERYLEWYKREYHTVQNVH